MIRDPNDDDLIKIRPRFGTVQISRGRTVFVSEFDGNAKPEFPLEGLYVYETRLLSRYSWLLNGKQPEFSCGSNLNQASWMG